MELNFDKEMDALLRQAAQQSKTAQAPAVEMHLDADEMAAFSANALPVGARVRVMEHLVDCGTCRTVMSNLAFFESQDQLEQEKAAGVAVAAPVAKESSLLDKIFGVFSMPALAYGMAGLVLLFTGALVFVVLQNSGSDTQMAAANTAPMEKPMGAKLGEPADTSVAAIATPETANNALSNAATAANTAIGGAFTPSAPGQFPSSGGPAANSNSVMRQPFSGGVPAAEAASDDAPKTDLDDGVKSAAPAPAPKMVPPAAPIIRQEDSISRPQTTEQQVTRGNENQQRNQQNNIMMPDGSDRSRRSVQVEAGATIKGAEVREADREEKSKETAPSAAGKGESKTDAKKSADKPKKKATPTPTPTPKPEEDRREEELPPTSSN